MLLMVVAKLCATSLGRLSLHLHDRRVLTLTVHAAVKHAAVVAGMTGLHGCHKLQQHFVGDWCWTHVYARVNA